MTQAGPYRGRIDDPVSVDGFWKELNRRRRWRRALPLMVGFLALSPAVAIAFSGQTSLRLPRPSFHREALLEVGKPVADPWGLVLRRHNQVNPWLGPLPATASRPSLKDSAIPAKHIQAAVLARASELRDCYVRSETYESGWGGTVVASLLITKDGEVGAAVGGDGELRRTGVSACVERTLSDLHFPAPDPDFGWVHLPLRFEP